MAEQTKVKTLEKVVIRFSGDSGDGMQLTGTIFSNLSAVFGNEISTFPDYPAEVRAPQGTLSGVSGFQVHLGSRKIFTPGDKADVLVANILSTLTSKILGTMFLRSAKGERKTPKTQCDCFNRHGLFQEK